MGHGRGCSGPGVIWAGRVRHALDPAPGVQRSARSCRGPSVRTTERWDGQGTPIGARRNGVKVHIRVRVSVDTGIGALDGRCIGVRRSLYEGSHPWDLISIELDRLLERRVLSVGARSSCSLRGVIRRLGLMRRVGAVALNRVPTQSSEQRGRGPRSSTASAFRLRSDRIRPGRPSLARAGKAPRPTRAALTAVR